MTRSPPSADTVALLVSTYESPAFLARVLASVLRQHRPPDEVLVADDGSGPATRDVVDGARSAFGARDIRLHHVWHADRGFRAGAIRNRALASVQSEYVVQIDGDVLLHPRFIAEHLRWARPGSFLCGRRADLTEESTERILSMEDPPRLSVRDFQRRMYALHIPLLTPLFLGQYAQSCTKGVMGSNTSYWRADALRVNGYDEDFEGWGKEDNDFVLRLMNAGLRRRTIVWSALQYHLHHPENDRARMDRNQRRLDATRASGRIRCARGIVEGAGNSG